MSELLPNGNLKIEAYSFAEFLSEFEQAVHNGFMLDLESNENFPQKYGDHLFVILKSAGTELVEEGLVGESDPDLEFLDVSTVTGDPEILVQDESIVLSVAPELLINADPASTPEVTPEVKPVRQYNRTKSKA